MAGELVLITGATGHIGFRTLLLALQSGYNVRAAVRSESKAAVISENPALKALNLTSDRLTFTIVPDLEVPGAYDEAVKGVQYVIHIASPLAGGSIPQEEYVKFFITPAVRGTIGMLESAKKEPSVKRVVITSSVVAIIPFASYAIQEVPDVYNADSRIEVPDASTLPNEFAAYSASKAASFNASEEWVKKEKPAYEVTNIHPSFVQGRDYLTLTAKAAAGTTGTNGILLRPVLGKSFAFPMAGTTVHVEDVAFMHVKALDPSVPSNQSYIANSGGLVGTKWENLKGLVEKLFPEQVKNGTLPNNGNAPTLKNTIDASNSEQAFGFTFKNFEEQVKSVVGHYVELVEQEQK